MKCVCLRKAPVVSLDQVSYSDTDLSALSIPKEVRNLNFFH